MSNLKKYFVLMASAILLILITFILETMLYYFNIITPSIYNIIKIIMLLLSFFIPSFILGLSASKKGYLEGIKFSLPLLLVFLVTSIIVKAFTIKVLLFYFIILLASSFGSMLGISRKKEL